MLELERRDRTAYRGHFQLLSRPDVRCDRCQEMRRRWRDDSRTMSWHYLRLECDG